MKQKFLTYSILPMLLVFLFIQSGSAGVGKQSKISIENSTWDFGYVPLDYKLIHIYKVKNEGNANLHITKMIPNCDCTIAISSDTLIMPDSAIDIKIVFDTKNYYGQNNRMVTVHSDDPENPTINLEYASNIGIFPKFFQIEPRSLFFLKGHRSKTLKISNLSDDDMEFTLELEPDSFFSIDKVSGKLGSKKDMAIEVVPSDKLKRGTFHSSFRVKFHAEPKPIFITVPIKIVRY
jgi:hypothetical protein